MLYTLKGELDQMAKILLYLLMLQIKSQYIYDRGIMFGLKRLKKKKLNLEQQIVTRNKTTLNQKGYRAHKTS